MFNDNELMIINRKSLKSAYVINNQIQIFRNRMLLQDESRSSEIFNNFDIWKKWQKISTKTKLDFYNKYEDNSLYNNNQSQLKLSTMKKFYHKYFSQIILVFEVKFIKEAIFNINQKHVTKMQILKYLINALFLILLFKK